MLNLEAALSKPVNSRRRRIAFRFRRIRLSATLTVVTIAVIAACGPPSASAACTTVPKTIPTDRLLTTGTTLRVPAGSTVYVVLVEEEGLNGPGFPWQKPSSSNRNVLAPVHLCRSDDDSSLPTTVAAFRAVGHGEATVTAPLARRWRSQTNKPRPAIDHVTVI